MSNPTEQFKLTRTIDIIEQLKGGAEKRWWWEDIKAMLDLMTEGHLFIGCHLPEDTNWYRGRQFYGNAFFSKLNQLTLKDKKDITNFGRCNKPHQAVLYVSSNLETAYSELGLSIGDRVETLQLRPKSGAKISYISVGEIDHVRRYNKALFGNEDIVQRIKDHWETLSPVQKLRLNVTDAFIADRFRKKANKEYDYKITSAFCDLVFGLDVDAFIYPSVGHLGGVNMAITEAAFKEKFEVIEVKQAEITDMPGFGIFGSVEMNKSTNIDPKTGDIEWRGSIGQRYFQNFEGFISYALAQPGLHKTLIFFFFKSSSTPLVLTLEASDIMEKANKFGKNEMISFQMQFDANAPLTAELDISKVLNFADSHNSDWDSFSVCIAKNLKSKEELDRFVTNKKTQLSTETSQNYMFNRSGEQIVTMAAEEIKNWKAN